MALTETMAAQAKTHVPEILELLSELEKRDKESKGSIQAGSVTGAGVGDPRGFPVVNTTGHEVGKVDDLYVDPNTRQPHFALLSLGNHLLGMGNRRVLVGYRDLTTDGDNKVHVRVALPQG